MLCAALIVVSGWVSPGPEAAVDSDLLDPDQGAQLMDQLAVTARLTAAAAIDTAIAELLADGA